ncbi:hypothetical protein KIPB_011211, partial [Kipferlia bialata]
HAGKYVISAVFDKRTIREVAHVVARFNPDRCARGVFLSSRRKQARFVEQLSRKKGSDVAVLLSERLSTAHPAVSVRLDNTQHSAIYFGLCPPGTSRNAVLRDPQSYLFDCSTGCVVHGGEHLPYSPAAKQGDVVTVEFDLRFRRISFSVNGVTFGPAFEDVRANPLFPVVVFTEVDDSVVIE